MAQGLEFDLRQLVVFNGSFGPREIEELAEAIGSDYAQFQSLKAAVAELESKLEETPASNVRLGVCSYLLGRYSRALTILKQADGGALSHFYIAKSHVAREEYEAGVASFDSAQRAGYDSDECMLAKSETLRLAGNSTGAINTLDELSGAVEQTAEYLCQRGATVAAMGGNPSEVTALYDRAVDADRNHAGALFGLALENDRYGNDETAMELYKRSADRFPSHVGSLLNLGLLLEDRDQCEKATQCYERILAEFPDHSRATLYLKDARASGDMYYDEDAQKKRDRMSQIMSVPVTDFELSVRSRNCLQKMGIMTLGDLCRFTEQELLASKNFGETSLVEIRDMLSSKGLKLGQLVTERRMADTYEPDTLTPDEQVMLARPISDLSLSVRARKCMIRLGISTIGELIRRTGDDLLECKNFGVTSLNEVRDKLSVHGLKVRGD